MSSLRVALTDVPQNLDPYKSNTLHIHAVIWSIYEPLFDIGHDGDMIPRLAESWNVSGDGLTYTFRLRDRIVFSDGTPFAAGSVVENLARAKSQPASFRERILNDLVESTEVINTQTARVKLRYPKPELLFLALMTNGPSLLGTGPFALDPASQSGLVLMRNAKYFPQAKLERIIFTKINPPDVVDAFKANQVDFVRDVDLERVRDIARDQIQQVRPFGVHYLGFNLDSTLFDQRDVRQAFRDALDFTRITSATGLAPANGPIPPGVEAYDPTLRTSHQNRADAARALKHQVGDAVITLLYNKNSYYGLELATWIARDLAEAKIVVKQDPKESSSELLANVRARGRGQNDHYVYLWNWYSILPAAEIFLRPLFERDWPDNLIGYSNQKFEAHLAAARQPGISPQERIDRYRRAQLKIVEDIPMVFLGHSRVRYSAHGPTVTGLELNVQSFPVDRFIGVDVH
jgi:peptide/nickel transport system substrate-binding protein